ncbi:hypothetical protein HPP92_005719 [Vanilla planifolia]|uniref:Protein TONSOKU n=1 Tax=Vanilla planifolia TaxID=51239 RepID=A0A835RHN7_VANPL|nr:hypothetical protein HPP92_005719 [Vanilla planifolia]
MGKEADEIRAAKIGYKEAVRDGNHEDEARWANVIGNLLKRRGEYVEALRWLRIDYEVSSKYLPQKQLLATCQSLGEVYLRLERFKEALIYQKKHLQLANDSDDSIEQQRASTQLGRTYHEMFLRSENDHYAIRNAKKYFKLAMKLVQSLKDNPPSRKSCLFLNEYIDAHNNIGMLEMDLDNLEEAEKTLLEGLKICDEEEVNVDDDGRSRLHHNLGSVYLELREWSKAREHIEKDVIICKRIGHAQGEAKGFINLGELHYRVQKYDEAILCYQRALDIARSMEDEDSLVEQISQNIKTVEEAIKVLETLKKDEQKLKKLMRSTIDSRGTANERKCLLEQNICLDSLIEKSSMIFMWPKHLEFAKRKKRVADELCDKEKLSDSFLVIGESYQKLRKFGDWAGALEAFEEGYRMAIKGNLPSVQLSALDNMHYSYMIRFDNVEEARKLQIEMQNVKRLLSEDQIGRRVDKDYCSETETEGFEGFEVSDATSGDSHEIRNPSTIERKTCTLVGDELDDVPLRMLVRKHKKPSKLKISSFKTKNKSDNSLAEGFSGDLTKHVDSHPSPCRKRVRVVLSDGENDEPDKVDQPGKRIHGSPIDDGTAFYGDVRRLVSDGQVNLPDVSDRQNMVPYNASKDMRGISHVEIEESACSFKSKGSGSIADNHYPGVSPEVNDGKGLIPSVDNYDWPVMVKIDQDLICVDLSFCWMGNILDIDYLKADVANMYYLWLFAKKRSKGMVPVILKLVCCGKVLDSQQMISDVKGLLSRKDCIEAVINRNETLEKIQQTFASSSQKYGGLTLDLHCNRFGPTALFQICECSVMFTRLEVLNLSQNRLTDACGSYLSTILENCKALCILKVEECSITSRTIQKITESLHVGSNLTHLSIGKNVPISTSAMVNLLSKLSSLKRFSELSLIDIRLNKTMIEGLCQFAGSCNLSALFLGGTCIGVEGTVKLVETFCSGPQELLKLDLSSCGITSDVIAKICSNAVQIGSITELNLGGNSIGNEGCCALENMLIDPQCGLKYLILDRCHLGFGGILRIVSVLAGNESLEELRLAGNANIARDRALEYHTTVDATTSTKECTISKGSGELEVADSEEEDASSDCPGKRKPLIRCQLINELSMGIASTNQLQLLDLSCNFFCQRRCRELVLGLVISEIKNRSSCLQAS